jgi:hypothetical protein
MVTILAALRPSWAILVRRENLSKLNIAGTRRLTKLTPKKGRRGLQGGARALFNNAEQ